MIHKLFWEFWEEYVVKYPKLADNYCKDDEWLFFTFRNEIQAKSDVEVLELMLEMVKNIKQ
jgi:hypothetical protein